MTTFSVSILGFFCVISTATSATNSYDLSKDKVEYVVTDAHLDTQWLYDIQRTRDEFVPNTLRRNFALFEKYPEYVFNFEGAYRYYLAKENYPDDYAKLKTYIAKGNWAVAGGMVDMPDVNVPSAESLMRHFLYGNGFFMDEFNKKSVHVMLPDNFGFSWALPTIASHCGMLGFSGMRVANCFPRQANPLIRWKGPDGSYLIAVTKTGDYNSQKRWSNPSITANGNLTSTNTEGALWATYTYFGPAGDRGGAPSEANVSNLVTRIRDNANQSIKVVNVASDQFFLDLSQSQINALPEYTGELHLPWAGCWTSNGAIKSKNRRNEQRAVAAEHAAVIANAYAHFAYPARKLWLAWCGFLVHQQHDDISGTSNAAADAATRSAMDASFADFNQVLNDADNSFSSALDTRVSETNSIPVVVFNQLSVDRHDVVETTVHFGNAAPAGIEVFSQEGSEVPAQIVSTAGQDATIAFVAHVPSVSYAVYEMKPTTTSNPRNPNLTVDATTGTLENRAL
jgi:alpha-mannosidase